ncbi:MAG TPA: hypothetical protein VKB80_30445 [Kofleriaceae bacterium]|nr:hypothetical protein [Kofleriaceae bacterium]
MLIHRRVMVRALAVAGALACGACTNARLGDVGDDANGSRSDGGGGGGGGGLGGSPDAGGGGADSTPDAAPPQPDAAPSQAVTLTQSGSLNIVGDNSVACGPDPDTFAANSYYRVFDLAALGVSGPLDVSKVTFGVQESTSNDGNGLAAKVTIHTLVGALQLANLTEVAHKNITIQELAPDPPGTIGGRLNEVSLTGATVPAGSVMVVEVSHDALGNNEFLLMGSNRAGQTGATFVRGAACGVGEPIDVDSLTDDNGDPIVMHWVLEVDGQAGGG